MTGKSNTAPIRVYTHNHTLQYTRCYDEINRNQDLEIYSDADSVYVTVFLCMCQVVDLGSGRGQLCVAGALALPGAKWVGVELLDARSSSSLAGWLADWLAGWLIS